MTGSCSKQAMCWTYRPRSRPCQPRSRPFIPEQARIYLNDQYKGDTPLMLTNLPPAKYRVRAEKRGFETDARDVSSSPKTRKTEEFRSSATAAALSLSPNHPARRFISTTKNAGTTLPSAINPMVSEPLRVSYIVVAIIGSNSSNPAMRTRLPKSRLTPTV